MPVYTFRCQACGESADALLPLGATGDRPCPACGGTARHRMARVAVRYSSWGFSATDGLSNRPGSTDFRTLRGKAEEIADS